MKNILIIGILFLLFSCSKEQIEEEKKMQGIVHAMGVEISYLNAQGQDLLDSTTPGFLDFNEMKLYC